MDLDGVVWRGQNLIDGAAEAIAALRSDGIRVVFATNDPRSSRRTLAARLTRLGIPAGPADVLTAAAAAAHVVGSLDGLASRRALVIGAPALRAEIRKAGFDLVKAGRAEVVVVGAHDHFGFRDLRAATMALRGGARLFATGRDAVFPMPDGLWPATGAILAAIETAGGATAVITGKPEPVMFGLAREALAGCERIAVVGDHLTADIGGARRAGLAGILVLSGTTSRAALRRAGVRPDLVLDSLAALPEAIRARDGRVSRSREQTQTAGAARSPRAAHRSAQRSQACGLATGTDEPALATGTDEPALPAESGLIHAGTQREPGSPLAPPLVPASVFVSTGQPGPGHHYGRNANPTWAALEEALGALEQAEAVVFGSGQAASMALMLALTTTRRRIILPADGYYNARVLAGRLRPHGAEPVLADLLDTQAVGRALAPVPAVLWAETPTNPLLRVADLTRLAELADAAGAPMVVDNTLATGVLQRPLEFGAIASMCSLTKSASGHSDVLLGAVLTHDQDLLSSLRGWRTVGGGIAGPFESWLALRGLRTLPLRIRRQSGNALAIARHLAAHPAVRAVHYPGTEAATLAVARRQMPRGFGPLLSFELDGDAATADAVVAASRLIVPATSFGGIETTWERRARWAAESAPASLIRLSAGIEPVSDLIADIDQSLDLVR